MNSNASNRIKAIAFDVDGTLTPFARPSIPDYLLTTLSKIPLNTSLAICTGRPLNFIQEKLDRIMAATPNPSEQRKRWFVICENGGAGYYWDGQAYQQFYELSWPGEEVSKEEVAKVFKRVGGPFKEVIIRPYTVVVRYPFLNHFPRLLRWKCNRTAQRAKKAFQKNGWADALTLQNSGIGCVVLAQESGKGKAMQRWGRYLGIESKELLCIGDRPDPGGNDEEFLSGNFGVPYTVGLPGSSAKLVKDEEGRILQGPKATTHLLKSMRLQQIN